MTKDRLAARAVALGIVIAAAAVAPPARADALVARGEYLAAIMDCTGCHTPGALAGNPDPDRHLAGSAIGFHIPGLGVFYPPNLTPDKATGIGGWSADQIKRAVRAGLRPDGRELAPAMPWRSYAALSDADADALAAYLKSLPPVTFEAPGPFSDGETPTAPYLTVVTPE
jgi:mono/diheme cytochrome c family protein